MELTRATALIWPFGGFKTPAEVFDSGTPTLADRNARIGEQWASDVVYRELSRRMPAEV